MKLKKKRLSLLKRSNKFKFYQEDIENYNSIEKIFKIQKPTIVVNLAAQAGVRYSLKNPKMEKKIDSRIYWDVSVLFKV